MPLRQPAAGPQWLPPYSRSIDAEIARARKAAVRTVTASGDVLTTDDVVLVDATAAPVTMTLPGAGVARGHRVLVKKIDASGNAVSIASADLIDGAASHSTTVQYTAWSVVAQADGWWLT